IDYEFRDDGDVRSIEIGRSCTSCGRSRRLFDVDIDYSPTEHLVDQPLTYCKNPKIRYDLRELTLYAKRADIARVACFLSNDAQCQFAASLVEKGGWSVRSLEAGEAERVILNDTASSSRYLWIYASPRPLKISALAVR